MGAFEELSWRGLVQQTTAENMSEILATPLTYWIVGFLKRAEQEDYYDRNTDFTPFSLRS